MADLRAVGDRVACEPIPLAKVSEGGIVIPDAAEADTSRSRTSWHKMRVVSTGVGRLIKKGPRAGERVPPSVKPGDIVIADRYSGPGKKVDGSKFRFPREDEIIAIIEEGPQE